MTSSYTEEKLSSMEKETIIQLFLAQQEQLENINKNLQFVLGQLADQKRRRFGRSSERHVTEGQISFMEVDGEIVFFNEPEAMVGTLIDNARTGRLWQFWVCATDSWRLRCLAARLFLNSQIYFPIAISKVEICCIKKYLYNYKCIGNR
ncbi:hypothetical protein IMSAGC013_00983 [Lachnospiraceae bacterium]|nr:hypothetical protein IMSAGC013_00983 [Lachnospiraceae bacterium]